MKLVKKDGRYNLITCQSFNTYKQLLCELLGHMFGCW